MTKHAWLEVSILAASLVAACGGNSHDVLLVDGPKDGGGSGITSTSAGSTSSTTAASTNGVSGSGATSTGAATTGASTGSTGGTTASGSTTSSSSASGTSAGTSGSVTTSASTGAATGASSEGGATMSTGSTAGTIGTGSSGSTGGRGTATSTGGTATTGATVTTASTGTTGTNGTTGRGTTGTTGTASNTGTTGTGTGTTGTTGNVGEAGVDARVDTGSDAAGPDRNCSDAKKRLQTSVDGLYALETTGGFRFSVWCAGMNTASPQEFLQLASVSAPGAATANYSQVVFGAVHGAQMCPCSNTVTRYQRLRINPATLEIDITNTTFATVDLVDPSPTCFSANAAACASNRPISVDPLPFAVAAACAGPNMAPAQSNIDLTGTPFHIAPAAMFSAAGYIATGSIALDPNRKVATLHGGGDCGWFGSLVVPDGMPSTYKNLPLEGDL